MKIRLKAGCFVPYEIFILCMKWNDGDHVLNEQVGISVFKILLQITRPKTLLLGKIPGTDIYRNLHHYKEATTVPGFLILSVESPINFANITYLNER